MTRETIKAEASALVRLLSVRLAAVAGLVAAFLAASPETTQELLSLLPEGPLRILASAGIGLFVFMLATGARRAEMRKP